MRVRGSISGVYDRNKLVVFFFFYGEVDLGFRENERGRGFISVYEGSFRDLRFLWEEKGLFI